MNNGQTHIATSGQNQESGTKQSPHSPGDETSGQAPSDPGGLPPLPDPAAPVRGGITAWLSGFRARYDMRLTPLSARLRTLMPFLSLAMGIITIVLFRKGFWYIRFVLIYLVVIWVTSVVLATLTRGKALGPRAQAVRKVSEFISQAMFQEAYFFLLPFYVGSSVPTSPQLIFLLLLVVGVFVSTFDPLYDRWVRQNRVTGYLFYAFSFFACLNFILPVVAGMKNLNALYVSTLAAILLTPPMLEPWRNVLSLRGLARNLVAGALVGGLLVLSLPIIPPAPLKVMRATFTRAVNPVSRLPGSPLERIIHRRELTRLVAYTPIFAPLGLKEKILHIWKHEEGPELDRIVLRDVMGGRKMGYRTWSTKSNFGPHPEGHWQVDVMTESGQLMGRLRFEVVP